VTWPSTAAHVVVVAVVDWNEVVGRRRCRRRHRQWGWWWGYGGGDVPAPLVISLLRSSTLLVAPLHRPRHPPGHPRRRHRRMVVPVVGVGRRSRRGCVVVVAVRERERDEVVGATATQRGCGDHWGDL
jgi:hypothetical protein